MKQISHHHRFAMRWEGKEVKIVRHAHPVYRYSVRAVRVVRLRIRPRERGREREREGEREKERPKQTPRNLHYLRLQRIPLCHKWGSPCSFSTLSLVCTLDPFYSLAFAFPRVREEAR